MFRQVIFSKTARKKLLLLLDHLELVWSIKVRDEFEIKLENCIEILKTMPESFIKSEINTNRYKYVVTKQTTIYYRFNSKSITIISVFDTRQDPKKIKKI